MKLKNAYRFYVICTALCIVAGPAFAQSSFGQLKADFLNPKATTVLIAAHRAVHHEFPENSIPAIQQTIEQGVHIIEIDVRVTLDGIPVIMHDQTIDRTTNGSGDIETLTYPELQKLFLVHDGKMTSNKIPTLEEVLRMTRGKVLVDLDMKTDKVNKVLEVVEKTEAKDHVFFFDSDFDILEQIQQADEDYMIMPRAYSYHMADSAIQRFSPQVVHIDFSFYDDQTVKLIKSHQARVWINALGDPDDAIQQGKTRKAAAALTAHGANIIQTDYPEELVKHFEAHPQN